MKFWLWLRWTLLFMNCASNGAYSQKTYDFIVVGAGAAGCCVARRLTESGEFKVLLIESGGMPNKNFDVPAYVPGVQEYLEATFQFESIPQKTVNLFHNGVVPIETGRVLGGTTSINSMWFNRGSPYDLDNWANATDDPSWSYDNMLKYFKRSENYKGDFPSNQHGHGGPITVSRPHYAPGLEFWLAAGRDLGYPVVDPNGPQRLSFTPVEFAKRHGRRVSAFSGYLEPVLNMPNLHILTNTNVTKVNFQGNRAIGVNFITKGTPSSAKASKEVIIAAGTFFSPLILQRSGIGPRHVLKKANIPVVKELQTGQNYHAHPAVNLNFAINNASVVMNEDRDLTPENLDLFNNFGDGPYTLLRGSSGQAFVASSIAKAEGNPDWADLKLIMSHSTLPYMSVGGLSLHLTAQRLLKNGEVSISCAVTLGRPKSRGSVNINPKDTLGAPIVDLNYLHDQRDFRMFLDGIQETLRVFENTSPYRSLGTRYLPIELSACDRHPVKSTEYWICYIKQTSGHACHPVGTNKMGKVDDPNAVVDSKLQVIGIDSLRIVDASIMPTIVNANPQADVYAIAEKAADMILDKWKNSDNF